MDVIRTIGLGEKIDLLARLLFIGKSFRHQALESLLTISVPPVLIRELIKTSMTAIKRGLPLKEFLIATVIRTGMTCFTERQLLYFSEPTSQIYQTWIEKEAKTRNLSPVRDTAVLADGTTRLH